LSYNMDQPSSSRIRRQVKSVVFRLRNRNHLNIHALVNNPGKRRSTSDCCRLHALWMNCGREHGGMILVPQQRFSVGEQYCIFAPGQLRRACGIGSSFSAIGADDRQVSLLASTALSLEHAFQALKRHVVHGKRLCRGPEGAARRAAHLLRLFPRPATNKLGVPPATLRVRLNGTQPPPSRQTASPDVTGCNRMQREFKKCSALLKS
jgi:hypothetical protein